MTDEKPSWFMIHDSIPLLCWTQEKQIHTTKFGPTCECWLVNSDRMGVKEN